MKHSIQAAIIVLALLTITSIVMGYSFNGREYEEIDGQWYEVYLDDYFKVVGTQILIDFYSWVTQEQIDSLNNALSGEVYLEGIHRYLPHRIIPADSA